MPSRSADIAVALAFLATGCAALALGDPGLPWPAGVALTAAYALPLAWRRSAPLAVAATVLAAVLLYALLDPEATQPTLPLALALTAYTLGRELDPATSLRAAVAGFVVFGAAIVADGGPGDAVFAAMLYGAPYVAGRAVRARAEHARHAAAHAERVVEEERLRIARELHDIVAHSISVVALQTEAVRRRLRDDQTREADDLRQVETAAREAMAEMRRLFGVLRASGDRADLAPQPGLGQLTELADRSRRAGVPVDVEIAGDPSVLTPGVDLAAFRIVQEALTNVRRHAVPASARVRVVYGPEALELAVEDDGRPAANGRAPGHGLVGMRERAALYGATLETGPRPGGGWSVRARFPLGERGR